MKRFQAGKPTKEHECISHCLKEYTLNDKVDAVKHAIGIYKEKEQIPHKPQRIANFRNRGIYDEVNI